MAEKDPMNWIEDASKAGKELREAIQEAHQMLRDLKIVRKELVDTKVAMYHFVECDLPDLIQRSYEITVQKQLGDYADYLEKITMDAIKNLSDQTLDAFKKSMTMLEQRFTELSQDLQERGIV